MGLSSHQRLYQSKSRHTEAYQHRSEVITTPYRHPKKHKDDIESSIKELLAMGHIRSSSIPFTSSVVLVKKKDGTMCMCIDYRTLNERIIKNRCPIPSIDELLDELHGAVYFTKIDLCSRYCYHRFLGITRRSCLEAHRSQTWSTEIRIDLSMALEGPSFSSSISFILSAAASITIGLVLYRKRFLLHEEIGLGIMVCVTFDH